LAAARAAICGSGAKRADPPLMSAYLDPSAQWRTPPEVATVAVVIPFYNGADFVERALASVFQQTRPAEEVIVVNDGSSNAQREALGLLASRYPMRIVDKENGGQGSARNAGVAASSAAYICFLDQDDFYLPDHIDVLLKAIPPQDRLFGFVYADLCEADAQGHIVRTSVVKGEATHPKRDIFDLLRHDMFVLPSASLLSRTAFESVGGFDAQFRGCEDDDLFLRIFRAGFSNHFVDQPVTVWCMHTESTSYGIHMVRSRLRFFRKLVAMYPDDPRRGRFHLRDQLIPRFERLFIDHVIESRKAGDTHRDELVGILLEYEKTVLASPTVSRWHKRKLKLLVLLARRSPLGFIRAMGALTRFPGLRQLRRMLG